LLISEVSGIVAAELELTIANGLLTLKGKRSGPADVPEERYRRRERIDGAWERSFAIPDRVLEEKVTAEYTDGILKIHLPKPPAGNPRQIPVLGATNPHPTNHIATTPAKTVYIEQDVKPDSTTGRSPEEGNPS